MLVLATIRYVKHVGKKTQVFCQSILNHGLWLVQDNSQDTLDMTVKSFTKKIQKVLMKIDKMGDVFLKSEEHKKHQFDFSAT